MIIRSEITDTLQEVFDLFHIDVHDFEDLSEVSDDTFQSKVQTFFRDYYIYFVMMYEESISKLKALSNSVEVNAKKFVLRHFILKVYLEGGSLSIN